jgi:hypothetical protein
LVGFGDYGIAIGMIAIIAAVAAGFWYAVSDDYYQPESPAENTSVQTTDTQAETLTDATGEQADANSVEPVDSVPPEPSPSPNNTPDTIDKTQLPWTTMVSVMVSEYSSLKAIREQSVALSNLNASAILDGSPVFAAASQVLIEENHLDEEIREVDLDSDDDNSDSPDTDQFLGRDDPQVTVEESEEPDISNEPVVEDRAENDGLDPVTDILDELADDLEDTDDVVSDLLQNTTDEVLELDEQDHNESENSRPGSQNSGKDGEEQDDSDNSGEDDNGDRSGSNRGPG